MRPNSSKEIKTGQNGSKWVQNGPKESKLVKIVPTKMGLTLSLVKGNKNDRVRLDATVFVLFSFYWGAELLLLYSICWTANLLNCNTVKLLSCSAVLSGDRVGVNNWYCQTPDQTKKKSDETKNLESLYNCLVSFFLGWLVGCHSQNSSDVTLAFEDAD